MSRTWDEFLRDNGFGLTGFCPTCFPKTHIKRRRPLEKEVNEEFDHVADHEGLDKLSMIVEIKEFNTSNHLEQPKEKNEVKDKGKSLFKPHSVNLSFDSHPKTMLGEGKNELRGEKLEDDNKFVEPVLGKSETTSRRFTGSMVSLSIPKTMEQNSEPIFVKDDSEQDNESPPHETSFKEFEHEQSSNHGNFVDNSPLSTQPEHEVQFNTTSNDDCSLEETLKAAQQSIKLFRQHKHKRLKEEEEARVILKTELQQ